MSRHASHRMLIRPTWQRVAYFSAVGSITSILFSIALSQFLLGLAILAVFASGAKLRFPPVKTPLVLFCALTVLSLLLSPDPMHGLPQIRKFYVFATLPIVFTVFQNLKNARIAVAIWS